VVGLSRTDEGVSCVCWSDERGLCTALGRIVRMGGPLLSNELQKVE
jgi:hypothetical protein